MLYFRLSDRDFQIDTYTIDPYSCICNYAYPRDVYVLGPLLLTWFNFNPSMDK